jgi:uncharacterized protein (TIGR04141 family)
VIGSLQTQAGRVHRYSARSFGAWVTKKKLPLTIFLLKPDRVSLFEKGVAGTAQPRLALSPPLDGYVLSFPSKLTEPPWVSGLQSVLQSPSSLSALGSFPAALMVTRQNGNTFVLSFGHAWQQLEDDWLQPEFGRCVALNTISPTKLVEIQIEQVFARWHVARERAPRASSVEEFGVEFDRDLVASVEGLPSHEIFGKKIRGGTSLRVEIDLSALPDALQKATTLSKSQAYRKNWPEIDNLSVVVDEVVVGKLEAEFDSELRSGEAQKALVMFAPTYLFEETAAVDSYVFGRMSKTPASSPYLLVDSWTGYLKKEGREPSISEAKATPIHLLDGDKVAFKRYSAFDCFGYELSLNSNQYILSAGIWYSVALDFLTKVNKAVRNIPTPATTLLPWDGIEREGAYNLRCGKEKGFVSFDAKNLRYGGGQSQLEFCDILHLETRTLFFVKIPTRSSGMSHLLEQVRRTTELFFSQDQEYRRELMVKIKQQYKGMDTGWLASRPRQGDWNICLISLGRTAAKLPFFARCGLAKLYKDLRKQGHSISFLKV